MSDKSPRTSIITDWRTKESDLPDVAPGDEYERVIAPQKFVVLHRVVVRGMTLVRLEIGAVKNVPFELDSTDSNGPQRTYRLGGLDDELLKKSLIKTGAAVASAQSLALAPGLEVRAILRNESTAPAKPRAALVVQEEVT